MSTSRKFKFRVWHPTAGKMFYQYLDEGISTFFGHESPEGGDCLICLSPSDNVHLAKTGRIFQQDKNQVIEQWTGLTDSNGKDIYEGDIIGDTWEDGELEQVVITVVKFVAPAFVRAFAKSGSGELVCFKTYFPSRRREIIGNIHQNPELLTNVSY